MFLAGRKFYPIGLDVSESSLKAVQLKKRGKDIRIHALAKRGLPPNTVNKGEIVDKNKLIENIHKLWKAPLFGQFNSKEVIAALPDSKSFIKSFTADKSLNDISETVESELEKHIPYKLEKVYYDWRLIEESKDGYVVLAGVVPRNISDDHYKVLTEAGLKVEALEAEAVALCRPLLKEENPNFKKEEKRGNYLIVDLGRSKTTFVVYSRNSVIFTTDIAVSGKDITAAVAKELNIDTEKAEKEKKVSAEAEKIVKQKFLNINKKVNEILGFYNNRYKENSGGVDSIILCGGGANYEEAVSLVASSDVKATRGDALLHLVDTAQELSKKVNKEKGLRDPSLSFSLAIGLALNKIFIK